MKYDRYHITFRSEGQRQPADGPPGQQLAEMFREELLLQRIPSSPIELWRDSAWSWVCFPNEKRKDQVELILSRFEPNLWLLACCRRWHLLSFFFGSNESANFRFLTEALIQILKKEEFSSAKWYFREPAFAKNAIGIQVSSIEAFERTK